MNASGGTLHNEKILNTRHFLDYAFADDPSYIPEGRQIWYSDRIIHPRIYDYKWKTTTPHQATIQTLINEPIYSGDVLKWSDDNGYWMIVGVQNFYDMNWEGVLQHCNFTLKFLSPLDGTLREYPISMQNATQYGTGEDSRKLITVGSAAHIIYLSYDEHTVLLDNERRFLIDRNLRFPTAFKLTQMDTSSYSSINDRGYLRLYVLEDQLNPKTDDIDNMIADAWSDDIGKGSELYEDDNTSWI